MKEAKQGHRYQLAHIEVIAMGNGAFPEVQVLDYSQPWPLRYLGRVNAEALTPLPMAYYHGETPK